MTYDEERWNSQIEDNRENEQNQNKLHGRSETIQNVPSHVEIKTRSKRDRE